MKKVIVFNGSPAASESNTNVIVQAFLKGARLAGAETENVFLIDKNINHCRGCFTCWFKTPGKCIYNDDMKELINKYNNADIVCFGTPVYTWNMTASLKNFVDRLAPLKSPIATNENGNFDLKDSIEKTQKLAVISNCGLPGENNFHTMKEVFKSCNPVLEIYRNSGKLLKSKDEKIKNIVENYLEYVIQAGYELVKEGKVSEITKSNLSKDLVSQQEYLKYIGM